MAGIREWCETWRDRLEAEFHPEGGLRRCVVISGDVLVTESCLVADELRFVHGGRLIFALDPGLAGPRRYHPEYLVLCRKLTLVGGVRPDGSAAGTTARDNEITWHGQRDAVPDGVAPGSSPVPAAGGSYDPFAWTPSDSTRGNHGGDGGEGAPGREGTPGHDGADAPHLRLVVLEVEAQTSGHLTVNFGGQRGGAGGRGEDGTRGGHGMAGRDGASRMTWSGTACERQPGHGGNGGNGGDGGRGGRGGSGGSGGDVTVQSTPELLRGVLTLGALSCVNAGGAGGAGGLAGRGGDGGLGGRPGSSVSACDAAQPGRRGRPGRPRGTAGQQAHGGSPGLPGSPGTTRFDALPADLPDLALLPLRLRAAIPGAPLRLCRSTATTRTVLGIPGRHLDQVHEVTTNRAGVLAEVLESSTAQRLDLALWVAPDAPAGPGAVLLHTQSGAALTLSEAFSVHEFGIRALRPTSGMRASRVAVTLTGSCLDADGNLPSVVVSGPGVGVCNLVLVDPGTVHCVLEIDRTAPPGPRDVTLTAGTFRCTRPGSFTVL